MASIHAHELQLELNVEIDVGQTVGSAVIIMMMVVPIKVIQRMIMFINRKTRNWY